MIFELPVLAVALWCPAQALVRRSRQAAAFDGSPPVLAGACTSSGITQAYCGLGGRLALMMLLGSCAVLPRQCHSGELPPILIIAGYDRCRIPYLLSSQTAGAIGIDFGGHGSLFEITGP